METFKNVFLMSISILVLTGYFLLLLAAGFSVLGSIGIFLFTAVVSILAGKQWGYLD